MIQGQDIICLSTSDWDHPIGSKQQVMRRLAKANRILYVEYQASWLHFLRYPVIQRRRRYFGQVRKFKPGLWTYAPRASLPFGPYLGGINSLNQVRLGAELRRAMDRLGFERPLLWLYTPISQPLIGRLGESMVVYHCISEFPWEKASRLRQRTLARLEEDLVRRADVVFASSTPLLDKFTPWTRNLSYLPSGVDWGRFAEPDTISPPAEMADLPRPRIGIVGFINFAFDVDVLEGIARSRPDWTLVHVGTNELPRAEAARLTDLPNWVALGLQPYDAIPGFLAGMDACLLPLTDTVFSRSVSSLRLMEYLAMGLPVVATDLPNLKAFKDVVSLARGVEGFIAAIEEALAERGADMREVRRSVARAANWDDRVETICDVIEEAANDRPGTLERREPIELVETADSALTRPRLGLPDGEALTEERPWREGAKAAISATIGQWTGRWTKPPLVRILLYHAIGPKGRRAMARDRVSADHFEAQMAYLAREGYSVVGMEAVVAGLQGDAALPERAVAITFDDGYSSVFHHALPPLKRLGFPATVYVVTDYALEGRVPLGGFLSDEEPLGPDELAALIDEGWTIGSHSATHPRLSSCWPEMAMEEFTESRERLAPVVGRPIDHFSAPHGDWTPELAALLKQAGYRSAATSRMGANRVGDNPLSLRRIEITAWDTAAAFRRKLDGSYDWLGLFRGA